MSTLPPSEYTPPTTNFDLHVEQEPPAWPKVIGIISIVWGSLGVLCGLCTMAQTMLGSMVQQPGGQFQPPPASPAYLISLGLGVLVTILLLIAGIMLVKRQAIARPMFLVYSVLSIVTTVVGMAISLTDVIPATIAAMKAQAAAETNPQAQQQMQQMVGFMDQFLSVITIVVCVIAMIFPLFCLVWFGAIKRKASDMGVAREVL